MENLIFFYKIIIASFGFVIVFLGTYFFYKGFKLGSGEISGEFEKAKFSLKKLSPGSLCIIGGVIIIITSIGKDAEYKSSSKKGIENPILLESNERNDETFYNMPNETNVDSLFRVGLSYVSKKDHLQAYKVFCISKGFLTAKTDKTNIGGEIDKQIQHIEKKLQQALNFSQAGGYFEETKSYKINDEVIDTTN